MKDKTGLKYREGGRTVGLGCVAMTISLLYPLII